MCKTLHSHRILKYKGKQFTTEYLSIPQNIQVFYIQNYFIYQRYLELLINLSIKLACPVPKTKTYCWSLTTQYGCSSYLNFRWNCKRSHQIRLCKLVRSRVLIFDRLRKKTNFLKRDFEIFQQSTILQIPSS